MAFLIVLSIVLVGVFAWLVRPESSAERIDREATELDLPWRRAQSSEVDRVLYSVQNGNERAELSSPQLEPPVLTPEEARRLGRHAGAVQALRAKRRQKLHEASRSRVAVVRRRVLDAKAAKAVQEENRQRAAEQRAAEQREAARRAAEAAARAAEVEARAAETARKAAEERRLAAEREAERDRAWAAECARREAAEAAAAALRLKLASPIPLPPGGSRDGIILGTKTSDGSNLVVPVKALQHMLIGGTTGSGKSVFVHQLIYQLLLSEDVEQLFLVDLKGGVEFYRYRKDPRVRIVWEFAEVARTINALVAIMEERQTALRECGLQNWPGKRLFLIIDEFAEIQGDIDAAGTKEEKEAARRVSANLVRIARRARALGIVLVCALQKPTADAMDSSLRTNLNCRICLRVGSRQQAAAVLDDLSEAPVDPMTLKTGRFIYFDASRGTRIHAQTQIAPGVLLADKV